ncbi:type IV secretory system conjugative DNA transfer family protein [Streptomyces scabiei]|uniref:type IV secretory system conjugative DNA transfer family protein n=1 Tax=Streptomyces scabiei TaxID=1930 RepID=UPI0029B98534|nr:TraM recognition domain-containing protein [Streptomyces scabiei]MDX3277311.1 TraM recognition domain-containing protein [Streptomyces scabiei]
MSFTEITLILVIVALSSSAIFLGLIAMGESDSGRVPYRLTFPTDLAAAQVVEWIRRISGTIQTGPRRLAGVPSIVFEVWADERGIIHRLLVPKEHERFIVPQLRTLVPGITVTPDVEAPPHNWTTAVELGHTNPGRTLDVEGTVPSSLLTDMGGLGRGESLLFQWVVSPAVRQRPPAQGRDATSVHYSVMGQLLGGTRSAGKDEINDRRTKLSEPNFIGVLRLAARGRNKRHAMSLLAPLRNTLRSVGGQYNGFKRRLVPENTIIKRVERASSPALYPAQVSTSELASLVAWPVGGAHFVGLPRARTRQLPATAAIPRAGVVLALSTFPEQKDRPLALGVRQSTQHMQIVGPTDSGKTTLLNNIGVQAMEAGRGLILIESKGDLFKALRDRVPSHRVQDVVLLDVTDTDYPVGFNILQGSPYVVASDIQRLFDHLYPQDARGVRVRQGFYHLILTLLMSRNATTPMTFADIGALAVPRADQAEFSDNLIRGVSHVEELAGWWQDITNMPRTQRDSYFQPIIDRTWQLNNRRSIRNIIGQSNSTIDLREVIRGNKILLVNLGRATEGKDTAGLVGSLLLNAVWSAVQGGAANPSNPTALILDEFQDFINLPIAPADMFAQARSMGLAMTVAHQHLSQLSRELNDATQNNARSTVVFQTSADEARDFARRFGRSVSDDDFMNLGKYEVLMRLATTEGVSSPVTGKTMPSIDPTGFTDEVQRLSRERYARPVAEVEAEISARRGTQPKPERPNRPRFGGPRSA